MQISILSEHRVLGAHGKCHRDKGYAICADHAEPRRQRKQYRDEDERNGAPLGACQTTDERSSPPWPQRRSFLSEEPEVPPFRDRSFAYSEQVSRRGRRRSITAWFMGLKAREKRKSPDMILPSSARCERSVRKHPSLKCSGRHGSCSWISLRSAGSIGNHSGTAYIPKLSLFLATADGLSDADRRDR